MLSAPAFAQTRADTTRTPIALTDVRAFRGAGAGWAIVGGASTASPASTTLRTASGTGVLSGAGPSTLATGVVHDDLDVAFEFLVPHGGRAEVQLHGRYAVQLGAAGDPACGAIAPPASTRAEERYFRAHAAAHDACRAPGLWQRGRILFRAPRFDAAGRKVTAARIERVELNGVSVQEGAVLPAPNVGNGPERPSGPLLLRTEGNGAAFRNLAYRVPQVDTTARRTGVPEKYPEPPIMLDPTTGAQVTRVFLWNPTRGPGRKAVTHPVTTGTPEGVHFSIDGATGALIRAWRGPFLDMSPSWNSRGGDPAVPMGAVVELENAVPFATLASASSPWPGEHPTGAFRFLGYDRDARGYPTFRYRVGGSEVIDVIRPTTDRRGLRREVRLTGTPAAPLHLLVSRGSPVTELEPGLFRVGDAGYYVRVHGSARPVIRNGSEILLPIPAAGQSASYELTW